MTITQKQQDAICTWLADGASLSDVQKLLKETFDLRMPYLDLRLLVLDLGAQVKDKPKPAPKPAPAMDVPADHTMTNQPKGPTMQAAAEMNQQAAMSDTLVSVTVDTLVTPATAMISGSVVFTDGEKAHWYFDRTGRFGFEPATLGYRPTRADSEAFEKLLQKEISQRGY